MTHLSPARSGTIAVGTHSIAVLPAWAAALSLSAAIAHVGVAAEHWAQWWAYGAFFYACAMAQCLLGGLVVWRFATWLALTAIAGNLAIVGMYVYSRTNGAPIGPHGGVPEDVGLYDLTTTAAELALVVVLILMLGDRAGRWALRLAAGFGVLLWTAKATGVLV